MLLTIIFRAYHYRHLVVDRKSGVHRAGGRDVGLAGQDARVAQRIPCLIRWKGWRSHPGKPKLKNIYILIFDVTQYGNPYRFRNILFD